MHLLAIVSCDDMYQPVKKGELVKHMKHEISVNHATDNGSKPSRLHITPVLFLQGRLRRQSVIGCHS